MGALVSGGIDAYHELNAGLAWRPVSELELVLTGHNLLHDEHTEFPPAGIGEVPGAIERGVDLPMING